MRVSAIGMFLSSLTESQIIAAVTTFGILLLIYLWGGLIDFLPTSATSGMIGIVVFVTIAGADHLPDERETG